MEAVTYHSQRPAGAKALRPKSAARPFPDPFIFLTVAAIASAIFYPQFSLTHDASWYLVSTQMFLNGAKIYSDIIEVNPPLAFYLTVPAVVISKTLSIKAATAYIIYCISIGYVSALWTLHLLRQSKLSNRQIFLFFGSVVLIFYTLPIAEFGQREHLMLMLSMPYLIYLTLKDHINRIGTSQKIYIGLIASLGLMLKPFFLFIPAGIILARLVKNPNWRDLFETSNLALLGAILCYVAFIAICHSAYIEQIVPMARLVYTALEASAAKVWLRSELLAFVLVVLVAARHRQHLDPAFRSLLGACSGALAAYIIQYKGWNYHVLPLSAALLLTASWAASQRRNWPNSDRILSGLLGGILVLTLGMQAVQGPYKAASTGVFGHFINHNNTRILVLSTNVYAAFPFVNEVSGIWASRFPHQWLVPGAYTRLKRGRCSDSECEDLKKILNYARSATVEDFQRYKPEVVFIDQRVEKSYFNKLPFDYLVFLSQDSRFRPVWSCYRLSGRAASYDVWTRICDR